MDFRALLSLQNGLYAILSLAFWSVSTVLYRRFFHQLSKIPGPFLAAVSPLYGFYYNVVKGGKFYLEIERLHEIYGPIVRIAPNEIHLSDRENYDAIYSIGSKFYKDQAFYRALGDENSIFATPSNELHRRRRAPLNPFFSRRNVLELEDLVQEKVSKLCSVVRQGIDRGMPVDLHAGFRGISTDVLTDYAFDDCWNQLDREDLGAWFSEMVKSSGGAFWVFQQFPVLRAFLTSLPIGLTRRLSPMIGQMLDIKMKARRIVEVVQDKIDSGVKPKRSTMFYQLLNPQLNPNAKLPTIDLMADEAFDFCVAASDTTGNAMTVATYNVITNPEIYETVRMELCNAFPHSNVNLSYTVLEKLPYLTGIIKKSLRLSYGVISRLPRVTPPGGATFNGYFVPEGTVVGMSSYLMHRNKGVFPDPMTFDPTRWTSDAPELIQMREKSLVSFSRGQRMCIGQNLAMCELYVTLGTLFRRFENLKALNVGPLTYVDYFVVHHPDDTQKLRVVGDTL